MGDRGLFHLNVQTGQITRPATMPQRLSAADLYEDRTGDFWMLTSSPMVGLVKYDRQADRFTEYPLGRGASLLDSSAFLADGENGFWVPSSLGLSYFDRDAGRFTRIFQHDHADPSSLSDNSVVSIYRDRSGLLWVGTENGGLNVLDLRQQRFRHLVHQPGDSGGISPGRVTAIHEDADGVLWVGSFPRALDRLDRSTGKVTRYVPGTVKGNSLSKGSELNSIRKDGRGHLWLGGWGAGLDRFDERTGRFKALRARSWRSGQPDDR